MGYAIPKLKGRKTLKLKIEIKHLELALEMLDGIPCTFWACKGQDYPRHMITCTRCWTIREILGVKASLLNQV